MGAAAIGAWGLRITAQTTRAGIAAVTSHAAAQRTLSGAERCGAWTVDATALTVGLAGFPLEFGPGPWLARSTLAAATSAALSTRGSAGLRASTGSCASWLLVAWEALDPCSEPPGVATPASEILAEICVRISAAIASLGLISKWGCDEWVASASELLGAVAVLACVLASSPAFAGGTSASDVSVAGATLTGVLRREGGGTLWRVAEGGRGEKLGLEVSAGSVGAVSFPVNPLGRREGEGGGVVRRTALLELGAGTWDADAGTVPVSGVYDRGGGVLLRVSFGGWAGDRGEVAGGTLAVRRDSGAVSGDGAELERRSGWTRVAGALPPALRLSASSELPTGTSIEVSTSGVFGSSVPGSGVPGSGVPGSGAVAAAAAGACGSACSSESSSESSPQSSSISSVVGIKD